MLLRDVQLTLRTLLVFQEAFPQTSNFEEVMKDEFEEQAGLYVEKHREQSTSSSLHALAANGTQFLKIVRS